MANAPLPSIRDADDRALVVAPDHQHAALGIGEAAEPLHVLVPPGLLPFDVLMLLHAGRLLPVLKRPHHAPLGLRQSAVTSVGQHSERPAVHSFLQQELGTISLKRIRGYALAHCLPSHGQRTTDN